MSPNMPQAGSSEGLHQRKQDPKFVENVLKAAKQ